MQDVTVDRVGGRIMAEKASRRLALRVACKHCSESANHFDSLSIGPSFQTGERMVRVSAVFVAACMVLICASFGAVLYLTFGAPATGALVGAIAALTGFAVCAITARTWRGRWVSSAQVVELSRGTAELARAVVEPLRRGAALGG